MPTIHVLKFFSFTFISKKCYCNPLSISQLELRSVVKQTSKSPLFLLFTAPMWQHHFLWHQKFSHVTKTKCSNNKNNNNTHTPPTLDTQTSSQPNQPTTAEGR